MTVMAAVVVLTIQETISAMVSAAKVISSRVIPISTIPRDVMMPGPGKWTPVIPQISKVIRVCRKHRISW